MTRLTDDLRALTGAHLHRPADTLVPIPIGALRAAIIALERFDTFPLLDRKSRPEWMAALPVIDNSREAIALRGRKTRRKAA